MNQFNETELNILLEALEVFIPRDLSKHTQRGVSADGVESRRIFLVKLKKKILASKIQHYTI